MGRSRRPEHKQKSKWPARRGRIISITGEKEYIQALTIARKRKRKKKGPKQILSKKALEALARGDPWKADHEMKLFKEGKKKKHKPSAAHGRGPKRGQRPRREKKKKKKGLIST